MSAVKCGACVAHPSPMWLTLAVRLPFMRDIAYAVGYILCMAVRAANA